MKFADILIHPYYVKDMCYQDDPGSEIERWIKNSIDTDDQYKDLPEDKRKTFYVSAKHINEYKRLLQEQTKELTIGFTNPIAVVPTDVVQVASVDVSLDAGAPARAIVAVDTERNLVNVKDTLGNLLVTGQERFNELLAAAKLRGFTDPQEEKNIRGYLVEIRNLVALYAKLTGQEDLMRSVGQGVGQQVAANLMTDSKKAKLRDFIRILLSEIDPDLIGPKLTELEEILSA
jgi:hypothetical protein